MFKTIKQGFSTIEVLITIPILIAISFLLMNLKDQLERSKKNILNIRLLQETRESLSIQLAFDSSCLNTFNGLNLNNFSNLKKSNGGLALTSLGNGLNIGSQINSSLSVNSIKLYGSFVNSQLGLLDVGDYSGEVYQGVIEVDMLYISNQFKGLTSNFLTFPIIFYVDSSNNVINCTTDLEQFSMLQSSCHQLGGVMKDQKCRFYTFSSCNSNDVNCLKGQLLNTQLRDDSNLKTLSEVLGILQ